MIHKLKVRFIILAMSALLVLLSAIVTGMNVLSYTSVVEECDNILSVISQNKGMFPEMGFRPGEPLPPGFSPETPFESRYFTVMMDTEGKIINVDTSRITSVDRDTAITYAEKAVAKSGDKGFIGNYRYIVNEEVSGIRVSFLDWGRRIEAFENFLKISIIMALAGFVVVSIILVFLAGKIVKPIAESYEKQKRFITDAGHEIKTPLTIINANVDILEMELGEENESLTDIVQQTKRLRSLTDNLVMLTRMEEAENTMQKIDFPISDVVHEAAHPFFNLAYGQGKEFICNIEPSLTLCGNEKSIEQLVCVLLDNALKYSPPGGTIALTLMKKGRSIHLDVFNTTVSVVKPEQLKYVFDRFYRTDDSRNSETGGHGIGLSVAKAVVDAHGGDIAAWTRDGRSFGITATLPI